MKEGDIIIGPSVSELLKVEVCHKYVEKGVLCGADIPRLSHDEWDKVNCPKCLALKNTQ